MRVLAQENHDMETKELHLQEHTSNQIDNIPSFELKAEEKVVKQWYTSPDDSESEEFFDIGENN